MRDIPYCPIKYIKSINERHPTSNGKFTIEGGPGIGITTFQNGLKVWNTASPRDAPVTNILSYRSNDMVVHGTNDNKYPRDGQNYPLRFAYLREPVFNHYQDIFEPLTLADNNNDATISDAGSVRILKKCILSIKARFNNMRSGIRRFKLDINGNEIIPGFNIDINSGTTELMITSIVAEPDDVIRLTTMGENDGQSDDILMYCEVIYEATTIQEQ